MRVQSILILIPSIIGFFWYFAYVIFAPKNAVTRKLMRLIFILSSFFLCGFLSADPESKLMLHFTLFEQVFALAIVPCMLSYIYALNGKKIRSAFHRLCNMVPIIHLIVGIESVYTAGYYEAVKVFMDANSAHGPLFPYLDDKGLMVFYAGYTYMFGTFLLINFTLYAINMMTCVISGDCSMTDVLRFFFKKNYRMNIVPAQYLLLLIILLIIVPALLLGRRCYVDSLMATLAACILLAFLVFMIGYVGSAGTEKRQSISGLAERIRFGGSAPEEVPVPVMTENSDDTSDSQRVIASSVDDVEDSMRSGGLSAQDVTAEGFLFREAFGVEFEKFMLTEKMFLKRDLTLGHAADGLGVAKDELSVYMDTIYGMTFSNYLNMLRVDFAEQYILDHDDATQKEIALACGYSGASAFNSAFSKLTGVTPKIWKDRYSEMIRRKRTI